MPQYQTISDRGPYWQPANEFRLPPQSLGSLGDDVVDVDSTPWWDIGTQLGVAQGQLNEMQQALRDELNDASIQAPKPLAVAIGADVSKAQAQLGDSIAEYNRIATLIGAPNLSGFAIPVYVVALVIALAATTAIVTKYIADIVRVFQVEKNKGAIISQAQGILQQAQQKAAAGDAAGAALLMAQYQALMKQINAGAGPDFVSFLNDNAPYLVAGVVTLFLMKR